MVRLTRLTRLRGAWDYVYGTFRIRRILLLVLVALSVALGPFLFFLPYGLRIGPIYVYAGTISITGFFMYGAFRNTLKSAIGSIFLGWRYKPQEFTPEQYAAFGVAQILNDMGIRKKVTICQTANPWIDGPFTNALTNKVYIPVSWLKKFPAPQDMRGVLGHELGHVKTKGRFGRESLLGKGRSYGPQPTRRPLLDPVGHRNLRARPRLLGVDGLILEKRETGGHGRSKSDRTGGAHFCLRATGCGIEEG
jgi:hypothetical protein